LYNLPEEKRERLVNAIKEEFARVPFHKVSINQIVQGAEISRGSFYQYFSDKKDMLNYILLDYQQMMIERIKNSLNANNGDIFKLFIDILDFTIEFGMEKEAIAFCKNLFADFKVNTSLYLNMMRKCKKLDLLDEFIPLFNMEILDLKDTKDFYSMLEILIVITRSTTGEIFTNISECEQIRERYINKIQLLQRGFLAK
jgi:AcrR family transcriptional regulator